MLHFRRILTDTFPKYKDSESSVQIKILKKKFSKYFMPKRILTCTATPFGSFLFDGETVI